MSQIYYKFVWFTSVSICSLLVQYYWLPHGGSKESRRRRYSLGRASLRVTLRLAQCSRGGWKQWVGALWIRFIKIYYLRLCPQLLEVPIQGSNLSHSSNQSLSIDNAKSSTHFKMMLEHRQVRSKSNINEICLKIILRIYLTYMV